jgi:hypothetical protein
MIEIQNVNLFIIRQHNNAKVSMTMNEPAHQWKWSSSSYTLIHSSMTALLKPMMNFNNAANTHAQTYIQFKSRYKAYLVIAEE